MSRALDRARKAIEKADADVTSWEGRQFDVQSQRAALDASAATRLLDDPSALDKLTNEVQRLDSLARQISATIAEAKRRAHDARRAALATEAEEEDREAVRLERERDAHQAKVDAAKAALEDLDGAGWVRFDPDAGRRAGEPYVGPDYVLRVPRADLLAQEAREHRKRAALLRYAHEHDRIPDHWYETDLPGGTTEHPFTSDIPESIAEFLGLARSEDPEVDADAPPAGVSRGSWAARTLPFTGLISGGKADFEVDRGA